MSVSEANSLHFNGFFKVLHYYVMNQLFFIFLCIEDKATLDTTIALPPPPVIGEIDTTSCNYDQFQCDDGQCIAKSKRCDAIYDCSDFSDEYDCTFGTCFPNQFKCDTGECIDASLKCNNVNECADASDELDCNNLLGLFKEIIVNYFTSTHNNNNQFKKNTILLQISN